MVDLLIPHSRAYVEILGGVGLFIFGIRIMSDGLQNLAGSRFRSLLEKAVSSRISAALLGTCLASILQSSASASIIVVGFLNAGLISLYQALAIFLGTSLGATVAVQFIAFQPASFPLIAIFLGTLLKFSFKRRYLANSGDMLLGAGMLFLGLGIMESGLLPLGQSAIIKGLNNYVFSLRIALFLFGALITFLVQSPAAASGIIIALCNSGVISFNEAIGMVAGCNLGAAFMPLFASIGGTISARRAAALNMLMNAAWVLIALLLFPLLLNAIIYFSPLKGLYQADAIVAAAFAPDRSYLPRLIANAYTICSLSILLLFLPLVGFLARASRFSSSRLNSSSNAEFLDSRILNTPTIAMLQVKNEIVRMAQLTADMYDNTVHLFYRYDARTARKIVETEDVIDALHRQISGFLVQLSQKRLDSENSMRVPQMLQLVNELEHLADMNMKLLTALQKKKREKLHFSIHAMTDLKKMAAAAGEIAIIIGRVVDLSPEERFEIPEILKRVEEMREAALDGHLKRMKTGHCSVEAGFLYNDMIAAITAITAASAEILTTGESLK
jgi:phosphate:Na+ symporter